VNKLFLLFKWMAAGSLTLLVSACYGVAYRLDDACWRMQSGAMKAQNEKGEPIPGLRVVVRDAANPNIFFESTQTDTNGVATFSIDADLFNSHQIDVIDDDGPENLGEFKAMTRPISSEELTGPAPLKIDVTMEEL
jgi:hypothetical protein